MSNIEIADSFDMLAKLMELYNEDSFKIRAYQNASRNIKSYAMPLAEMPASEISSIPGVGKAVASKVSELLRTGSIQMLDEIVATTPAGIIEMMQIKGIGIKKIQTIWKELHIDNTEDLLKACKENLLSNVKGFGVKTQTKIQESIEFYLKNQNKVLLAAALNFTNQLNQSLTINFPDYTFLLTGDVYIQNNVIDKLQYVTNADDEVLKKIITLFSLEKIDNNIFNFENGIQIEFIKETDEKLIGKQFQLSCTEDFYNSFATQFSVSKNEEASIFSDSGLQYIPPCMRNNVKWIQKAKDNQLPELITTNDIKGIIHCHSTWSDGANTIEEIVNELRDNNFEYLVLSDHSKSAFYAEGLKEDRIVAQHKEIDNLNNKYTDFTIFKSIESDILNNGSLDYAEDVLQIFDLVIASVHTNLGMNEEAATKRIITAVENPYTNILGHMTGRLLLMRSGYPVNHKKIIDACAANNVVIEINANPRRLDIDWRHIEYALEKNVLLSINPDAHNLKGLYDIHYGVLSAQKAGLSKNSNLSSYNLTEFKAFIAKQQLKRQSSKK